MNQSSVTSTYSINSDLPRGSGIKDLTISKTCDTFTIHYVNKCHALKNKFLCVFVLENHGFLQNLRKLATQFILSTNTVGIK